MWKFIVLYMVFTYSLFAYVDSDFDGVDDGVDLCLDTPFEYTVDRDGCRVGYKGKIRANFGVDIVDGDKLWNLYLAYEYQRYELSISTSINRVMLDNLIDENDLYLKFSYLFVSDSFEIKSGFGVKFYLLDEVDYSSDYFVFSSLDYRFSDGFDYLGYFSYTFDNQKRSLNYQDYYTISSGVGYSIDDEIYLSILYSYTSSYIKDRTAFDSISLSASYSFRDNLYGLINYQHSLSDDVYQDILSFNIGVSFE